MAPCMASSPYLNGGLSSPPPFLPFSVGRCILCLLFLVVLLAIGAIVLSIIDFGGGDSAATTEAEVML